MLETQYQSDISSINEKYRRLVPAKLNELFARAVELTPELRTFEIENGCFKYLCVCEGAYSYYKLFCIHSIAELMVLDLEHYPEYTPKSVGEYLANSFIYHTKGGSPKIAEIYSKLSSNPSLFTEIYEIFNEIIHTVWWGYGNNLLKSSKMLVEGGVTVSKYGKLLKSDSKVTKVYDYKQ